MSLQDDDLDTSGIDPDSLEGGVEKGWYRTTLTDIMEDHKKPGDLNFKFTVTAGRATGRIINERLGHPLNVDPSSMEIVKRRRAIFAQRLRLITKEQIASGGAKINWMDAIGEDFVVHMVEKADKKDATKTYVNMDFAGVYPPGHDKLPPEMRDPAPTSNGSNEATPPAATARAVKPTPTQSAIDYSTL